MTHSEWAPRHWRHFDDPAAGPGGTRHRHGRGPRGRGFGPGPGFGSGRGRRRRGDVRLALLHLLAEEPRNGYQLMQAIEERSAGRWSPSPGSVYPALSQLEDEGLIRATEHDGAKLFELTEAGTEYMSGRQDTSAPWELEDDAEADSRREVWSLVPQVIMAVKQVQHAGDEAQIERARTILTDARRALYRVLAGDEDEQ